MTTDGDARPAPGDTRPAPGDASNPGHQILDQAFDADSLYALRAAVAAHASDAGLPPGRADDLVIAVHELAANAVRHGAGHGRLRIRRSDQALLCEISDDGAPPPASAAEDTTNETEMEPPDAAQWRTEPGHGLSLVRQVADQTSLRSGPSGTLATISFGLAPSGPPFRLDHRDLDRCTVLAVTGPLDLASASQLSQTIERLLAETPALKLVLELDGLAGWDSVGLAALITVQQRVSASPPARMVLAGLPDHLEKHLRQASLADRFTLADSSAAAASELSGNEP
jgi:anti-anti-sigma factor